MTLQKILGSNPIIPVVTPLSVDSTVKVAEALVAGGINTIEITLRTDCALEAIQAVKDSDIDITLGVGTIINGKTIHILDEIGVDFGVSPGLTNGILQTAKQLDFNILPGVATPSELIKGMSYGFKHFKIFPANAIDSKALLKAFNATFPGIQFCPTGGVSVDSMNDYLQLPNVICVGGSWLASKLDIELGNYSRITENCQSALAALV
ncbi:MAG: bifunctional 4-hydroxy-2-oxoglutarate aldolase/2-dehydro-3-deoxy-phosphogluconate aldolase [Gammaproteobacteria bacterium]|nr:bifunctional 4-hydroxy-2-oxoglutarate aldolase/2-dehydro-3-deoxy-phosphogluconate aldolase [Gammaproteobacteria bacterium]NNM14702.1 bifunctional 4-hydroxy-2-oxoglutarate aldolase/2-dehydro-3-deoxy-phosphogluconate aldolase [Gammaproteobacteria bacterium]